MKFNDWGMSFRVVKTFNVKYKQTSLYTITDSYLVTTISWLSSLEALHLSFVVPNAKSIHVFLVVVKKKIKKSCKKLHDTKWLK